VLELPTDANRAKFAELESQISAASAEAKIAADAAYQGWREGLFADGKPAEGKGLPEGLAAVLRKGEAERSEEEKKSLEPGLRKHFDEKVRPGLAGKIPSLAQVDALQKQLDDYRADKLPRLMVMSDERPRETTILNRGDYLSPGEKVSFATPAFLPPLHDDAPRNRLGFARWLVSPEHPLAARVQVNRMWQYFFGAGIVKTAEDFGVQSEYPIHGELLDWLAVEFRARGWSRKALHRLIVTSAAYRQSGRTTPEQFARDRENRLFARASRFRMPSMVLRDWALAAAGLLDGRIGGAPVYPYQPDAIWEALAITKERDFTYPASSGADLYRRSLYTFWRRTVGPANMFDASNRQTCRVRQAATSTPLHSLTTLNDPTWVEAARMLAEASMKATANLDERLAYCFRRVVARTPAQQDLESLRRLYERQAAIYRSDAASAKALLGVGAAKRDESLDVSQHAALAAVCLAILNLDEALTRE
jgi:hypothetical protein